MFQRVPPVSSGRLVNVIKYSDVGLIIRKLNEGRRQIVIAIKSCIVVIGRENNAIASGE